MLHHPEQRNVHGRPGMVGIGKAVAGSSCVRFGLRARSGYWSRADGDTVQSSSGKHQGVRLSVVAAGARAGGLRQNSTLSSASCLHPARGSVLDAASPEFLQRTSCFVLFKGIQSRQAQSASRFRLHASSLDQWFVRRYMSHRTSFLLVLRICITPVFVVSSPSHQQPHVSLHRFFPTSGPLSAINFTTLVDPSIRATRVRLMPFSTIRTHWGC